MSTAAQITPLPAVCSTLARDLGPVLPVAPTADPRPGNRVRWLCGKEAAGFLGCSVKTLLRAVRRGDLPAFRPGAKDYLFTEIDLAAFVAARTVNLSPTVHTRSRRGRPWAHSRAESKPPS